MCVPTIHTHLPAAAAARQVCVQKPNHSRTHLLSRATVLTRTCSAVQVRSESPKAGDNQSAAAKKKKEFEVEAQSCAT